MVIVNILAEIAQCWPLFLFWPPYWILHLQTNHPLFGTILFWISYINSLYRFSSMINQLLSCSRHHKYVGILDHTGFSKIQAGTGCPLCFNWGTCNDNSVTENRDYQSKLVYLNITDVMYSSLSTRCIIGSNLTNDSKYHISYPGSRHTAKTYTCCIVAIFYVQHDDANSTNEAQYVILKHTFAFL